MKKPVVRAECYDMPRPCVFVSCKYNTFLEVVDDRVVLNKSVGCPTQMDPELSCVLDIAESRSGFMVFKELHFSHEYYRGHLQKALNSVSKALKGKDHLSEPSVQIVGHQPLSREQLEPKEDWDLLEEYEMSSQEVFEALEGVR